MSGEWVGKAAVLCLGFSRGRRKVCALKNLTGALPTEAVRYTLSHGREVKTEIPGKRLAASSAFEGNDPNFRYLLVCRVFPEYGVIVLKQSTSGSHKLCMSLLSNHMGYLVMWYGACRFDSVRRRYS